MNLEMKLQKIKEGIHQEMNEKILQIQNQVKKELEKKESEEMKRVESELKNHFNEESKKIINEQKRNLSRAILDQRNKKLRVHAELIEQSLDYVKLKLQELRKNEAYYKELMKVLIVEATEAIQTDNHLIVYIDERDKDLINEDFLSSIEIIFTFNASRSVRYKISDKRITTAGGVVLQAEGKPLSCNNTLEERLDVESHAVKSIISELLLKEGE